MLRNFPIFNTTRSEKLWRWRISILSFDKGEAEPCPHWELFRTSSATLLCFTFLKSFSDAKNYSRPFGAPASYLPRSAPGCSQHFILTVWKPKVWLIPWGIGGYRVITIEFTEGHWVGKINSEVDGSWLPYIRTTTLTIVVGKDRPPR